MKFKNRFSFESNKYQWVTPAIGIDLYCKYILIGILCFEICIDIRMYNKK